MILFYTISGLLTVLIGYLLAKSLPLNRLYKSIAVGCTIACTYLIYMSVGALPQLQQYQLKKQEKENVAKLLQSMDGKKGLINSLKDRLQIEPASAQGHYLLAKLLASEGQWKEAVTHFVSAKSIDPKNVNYQVNYAHALWQLNHNQFNKEIRHTFKQLLQHNPNQIDALNMLAMDAYQQNNFKQAVSYWRRLLKLAPPGSEDAKIIEEAIHKTQTRAFEQASGQTIKPR